MQKLINISINMDKRSQQSTVDYVKAVSKTVNAYLQQINSITVLDVAKSAAREALLDANIRVQGATQLLIDGIQSTVKDTSEEKIIKINHRWFRGFDKQFKRKSKHKTFTITGRNLYKIMDTGRKRYEIVSKANSRTSASPLQFFWGKTGKFMEYYWKGPRGGRIRFLVVKPHSYKVDFSRGARITDAIESAIERMVEERNQKIQQKMATL